MHETYICAEWGCRWGVSLLRWWHPFAILGVCIILQYVVKWLMEWDAERTIRHLRTGVVKRAIPPRVCLTSFQRRGPRPMSRISTRRKWSGSRHVSG